MLREGGQVRRCLPPSFEVATSKPPRFFLAVESRSCQSHARCSADAIPLLHIEGGRRRSRCSCWAAGTASGQPGPLDPEDSLRGTRASTITDAAVASAVRPDHPAASLAQLLLGERFRLHRPPRQPWRGRSGRSASIRREIAHILAASKCLDCRSGPQCGSGT